MICVQDQSPGPHASLETAGCEAGPKAQGTPNRPGTTGEGKAGRVSLGESPAMPRQRNGQKTASVTGRQALGVEKRQVAALDECRAAWTPPGPG
jgi:hypothetical protein